MKKIYKKLFYLRFFHYVKRNSHDAESRLIIIYDFEQGI